MGSRTSTTEETFLFFETGTIAFCATCGAILLTDEEEVDIDNGKEGEVDENEADDEKEVLDDQKAASISLSSRKNISAALQE